MENILNDKIDKYFDGMVKNLQEFVKIRSVLEDTEPNSTAPFGGAIDEALKYVLNKGKELGLKTKNVDGFAGYIEYGDGPDMVGILGHVDIVPEGEGWSVDPYGGEVKEGKLYGRGAMDDKGPILAVLYGLKAIKESNLPVSKRARLIIGTDEESGGRCIKHYLEKEEAPIYGFSPDASFPIIYAEKGILRFELNKKFDVTKNDRPVLKSIKGGTRVNVVPSYAEALIAGADLADVKHKIELAGINENITVEQVPEGILIRAKGVSAHAMHPEKGKNAIQALLCVLKYIDFSPVQAKQFLDSIADKLMMETDGLAFGIACDDDISGTLTLNTGIINFNEMQGSIKFDVRYPVKKEGDKIIEKLQTYADSTGLGFTINQHKPPLYMDKDSEIIKRLQHVYKEMTGDEPELISIGGGTYCRYVKNTVSFGPVFPGQKELAHQRDEFIDLEDFRKMSKIYAQAVYELIK